MTTAILGVSMPHFWLGLILLFYFAVHLGWFPVAGSGFPNLVLPALTLGLTNAAIIALIAAGVGNESQLQECLRATGELGCTSARICRWAPRWQCCVRRGRETLARRWPA